MGNMSSKIRVHFFISPDVAALLTRLSKEDRRTKSALVELALIEYEQNHFPKKSG
jgi:hypothetical protein